MEAAPENSRIDLSNNEIEIRIKLVLIREFPEVGVFFSVLYGNLVFFIYIFAFCFKINMLHLLKMVKI